MPLKSMKELSQPLTLTIPEDSPIYKALMESTKQKNDDEHKVACLEADLEETTDTLLKKISDLEKENEKLKEKGMKFKKWYDEYDMLTRKYGGAFAKDLDNFIISLKEENKKLKCYNTEECNARQADYDEKCDECQGLEEEIEELKEKLLHEQQKGTSIDTEEMDKLVNIFDEQIASCDIADEVMKLKKLSDVKTDLILNLFQEMVNKADMDDGLSISKEYGHKYIDEWNKTYDNLIKETIDTINKCHFDPSGGDLYLQFYSHDNIEFRFHNGSEEESEEESEDS